MTESSLSQQLREAIKSLAMAITHSEQGSYEKNEAFVRDTLSPLLTEHEALQRKADAGKILAFIFEDAREELPDLGFFTKTKFDAVMNAYKEAVEGKNDEWIADGFLDMDDYREATKPSDV